MFANLDLTNEAYIKIIEPGHDIVFLEKKLGGRGKTQFNSTSQSLIIKAHDKAPLVWALKNRKCAEGAFLTFNQESASFTLHILEMKSKLTTSEFLHVLDQFSGMYLSAISMMAVMQIPQPSQVKLYIAYKSLAWTESQPYQLKTMVGGQTPKGATEWLTEKIKLPHGIIGQLVKGKRVEDDLDFGVV